MQPHEITGSADFQRLNPHLFAPVAARPAEGAQPMRRSESPDCRMDGPAPGVAYCVTLIQCRRRLLDSHDSMRFAVKPTVDFITEWLGFKSDSDPRLTWEYAQHQTTGAEGVIVKIDSNAKLTA